jgi:hypothetical protein
MSEDILNLLTAIEVQQFICLHENEDAKALVLKRKTILGIPTAVLADQINGRKKAKTKLPCLYETKNIIYPRSLSLEQSSSEITAKFKARLLNEGQRFLDLTGGFGVDTFFFAEVYKEAHYVETNSELLAIARHNHRQLGNLSNIQYHNTSAEDFLHTSDLRFDVIYVDPSRRSKGNQKVFKLSDCTPDVPMMLNRLFGKADILLLKTSPLLDIQQALKELSFVEKVIVVSVQNDCKELLFFCRKNFSGEPVIEAVNIIPGKSVDTFQFVFSSERREKVTYAEPLTYIFEPNTSVLKAGAFKSIASRFDLYKIQTNTHLYTAEKISENFPGRIFRIISRIKPESTSVKAYLPEGKANIITRNYPLTPDQLKKKIGLNDGGDKYVIGFSGTRCKHLVVAERIQ